MLHALIANIAHTTRPNDNTLVVINVVTKMMLWWCR